MSEKEFLIYPAGTPLAKNEGILLATSLCSTAFATEWLLAQHLQLSTHNWALSTI
ncbi:MAG: hypothetical protein KME32_06605 [Mojavia pulchra JT2-VF2]|uniref:Uncharacterized protein n=1 Tax=Mojavia pulchra JT2-VF2 TaxID=287848 RepID=A0A951PXC9_9NOST|nr:hypothetical protein [Mojavia pulchra JT2-VF2]